MGEGEAGCTCALAVRKGKKIQYRCEEHTVLYLGASKSLRLGSNRNDTEARAAETVALGKKEYFQLPSVYHIFTSLKAQP